MTLVQVMDGADPGIVVRTEPVTPNSTRRSTTVYLAVPEPGLQRRIRDDVSPGDLLHLRVIPNPVGKCRMRLVGFERVQAAAE